MTTVMTTTKQWQDQYLTMMARVEEPIVRYAGKAAGAVATYVPERPEWTFLDQVPTITELVESQLKFRRRVVDEQAAFVRKFMKAACSSTTRRRNFNWLSTSSVIVGTCSRNAHCGRSGM